MDTYRLYNGVEIPSIGFGTGLLEGEKAYKAVLEALKQGYRHVDTAQIYNNETMVGKALKDSNLDREAVFITTKLDPAIRDYQGTLDAFAGSLERLNLDYVDLFLIHAPYATGREDTDYLSENLEIYRALEYLLENGLTRSIGVSNFSVGHIETLLADGRKVPHVNQVKQHIGFIHDALLSFCSDKGILVEAYSPLAQGALFGEETLKKLADALEVSVSQLAVRYLLDRGLLPLPRSKNPAHIAANFSVDFSIDDATMETLDTLNLKEANDA